MGKFFSETKKMLAFGCMRLPMQGDEVDLEEFKRMVDEFIAQGFNYFDTAHGYINGKSEKAIKKALVERYDRSQYLITDKLTEYYFKTEEDIIPLVNEQLEIVGVDYFDFYLMHMQNRTNYEHFKKCRAYETAFKLKEMGKIHHVGISFHDTADILDKILTDYPQIEVVQIQLNYIDYDFDKIQSRKCYDVCVKHNKPVLIMEPVKGGQLVKLPEEADKVFRELNNGSNASYSIRFAASHDNVEMVLSGMSNLEQLKDNTSYMKDFVPLNEKEYEAINKVVEIFHNLELVPCTDCRYCVSGCTKEILIPDIFKAYNAFLRTRDWSGRMLYHEATKEHSKASDCIKCGKCERICPQHLKIRDLLVEASELFDK